MRSAIQVITILAIGLCGFVFTPWVDAAPSAFSLISPENGATVLTKVLLDWEDSTDTSALTYTLFLSKGNNSFEDSDNTVIAEIAGSCRVLTDEILEDNSTYYWKVRAINKYGQTSETGLRYFITDNGNPVVAWIGGHVYSSFQQSLIPNINIIISNLAGRFFPFQAQTDLSGSFCGELKSGEPVNDATEEKAAVEISATGCKSQQFETTVVFGELTELPDMTLEFDGIGDINKDDYHDLNDAILALQILAGEQPSGVNNQGFPNQDNKIGLSELIYILQRILEPSPCAKNSV